MFYASAHCEIIGLQREVRELSMLASYANRGVRLIEKHVLNRADTIIVRSEFVRQEIRELYGERRES